MAVVLNASGVNRVRFTVINNMKSLFHPQREIHYIGGTDIAAAFRARRGGLCVKSVRYKTK